jgi:hypothetical protein
MLYRLLPPLLSAAFVVLTAATPSTAHVLVEPTAKSVVLPPSPSPAHCRIEHIGWPHFAKSVPGAVKVNAIAQCDRPVEEQTLSVVLTDTASPTTPLKRTVTKNNNEAELDNKGTWVRCKDATPHTFRGMALGASWEGGRPYTFIVMGPERQLNCGY